MINIKQWLTPFLNTPVIIIPIFNAFDDVTACIESLLSNTLAEVPILALDDASTDNRVSEYLSKIEDKRFLYVRKLQNRGFVDTVNLGFEVTAPNDIIVINSDVIVPPEWLGRLRSAAYYRSNTATATPFTNYGSIVSIPYRNQPGELPDNLSLQDVDNRVRQASLNNYPPLPTAIGHCVYFRRTALDRVGFFDEVFAPGYGEEVDFSQRALMAGFIHVLADDLFVYHKGSQSFASDKLEIQQRHEQIIRKRYPWYHKWSAKLATSQSHPLAIAIERAIASITQYRVVIDATYISGAITGTQIHTVELIRALAKSQKANVQLSVIIQDGVDPKKLQGIDQLVDHIITITEVAQYPKHYFHLAHRNFQIRDLRELKRLSHLAQRVIISQLDLITFSNPAYVANADDWLRHVDLTRGVLNVVDGIIYNSDDVVASAIHQGIYTQSERMRVIYPGVDHLNRAQTIGSVSNTIENVNTPFILMLGSDFQHKNRIFGLKVLRQLINRYDWHGYLIFAGPSVHYGGSIATEKQFLKDNPNLSTRVKYLPAVSEADKQWLFSKASLLLYPSTYEGFGMVPFEVAEFGTPAISTTMTSLKEVLGDEVLYLDSLNAKSEVEKIWSLLTNTGLAQKQVYALRKRKEKYTWLIAAQKTWTFYEHIMALMPRYDHENFGRLFGTGLNEETPEANITLPKWRHLSADAFYILFTRGLSALFKEIRQYLQWLWMVKR